MVDTITYKCYLATAGSGPRIEKFKIDRKVRHSLMFLKEKLYKIYAELKGKQFTITWKDEDGDEVIINSNESLSIALNEQDGPIYRIYVEVLGEKEEDEHTHPGVVCDGCEQPVVGNRYKCIVCADYDLCKTCENKGLHPGHNMVRMTSIEDSISLAENNNMQEDFHQNFFQKFNNLKNQQKAQKYTRNNSNEPRKYTRNNSNEPRKRSNSTPRFLVPNGKTRNGSKSPRRQKSETKTPSNFNPTNNLFQTAIPGVTQGIFQGPEPPNAKGGVFQGIVIDGGKDKQNTYIGQMVSPQPGKKQFNLGAKGTTQPSKPDPFKVRGKGKGKKAATEKKEETKKPLNIQMPNQPLNDTQLSNERPKTSDNSPVLSPNSIDGPILVKNNGPENPNKPDEELCEDLGDANLDIPPVPISEVREKIKKSIIEKLKKEGKHEDDMEYFYSSDEDEWTLMRKEPLAQKDSTSSDSSIELISPPSFTLYPTLPPIDPTPIVEKKPIKKDPENKLKEVKTETKPSYAQVSSTQASPKPPTPTPTSNIVTPQPTPSTPTFNNPIPQPTPTFPIPQPTPTNQIPQPTSTNPIAVHPNERVRVALQAMLNMGYTNERGWLANLLENFDADIGAVLDILNPRIK